MYNRLVSIILPVHNGEQYLEEAVNSIFSQTYKNWELIIVDDKSTDRSLEIAKKYQEKDTRIKIINNNYNIKLPASLNKGFEMAQGEYLTWTSDDNIYYPNAIYEMVDFLEKNLEFSFVYTDMERIDSQGTCIGYTKSKEIDIYLYNCIGACFLYRKECMKIIGGYNQNMFLVEDYDYWLRIAQKYRIGHISKVLYAYRLHSSSLTMSKMKSVGEQLLKMKLLYFDFLYEKICDEYKDNFIYELLVYDENCLNDKKNITNKICDIKTILPKSTYQKGDKVYLYGAGSIGQEAIRFFGDSKIIAFIDSNPSKIGGTMGGHDIISLDAVKKDFPIIITTDVRSSFSIIEKLKKEGMDNFDIFYKLL